ncbi:MAG: hypothetical protein IJP89_04345, partial [Synergistaceae bacterium]|nr:hypothetical protein [Synergistaceae bacterium]
VINLVEPEWSGYNFAGWIGDNVCWINEDATTLTIPANTAEDLTFTATWRKAGAFTPATGDNANKPEVAYHSMVLGGQLSVMFYVYFPDYGKDEAATTDILPSNSTVTFTVNGVSESYNANIATPAKVITDGQYTLHGYECFISSVEMADDIVMTLTCDANDEYRAGKELQTYKALTYLNALTGSNSGESEAAKNLGKAIMDYGYYVQPMLAAANGWTLDAENSHTTMTQGNDSITVATANDLSEYKITVKKADDTDTDYSPSEETTITNVGFSLFLDNVTTIRLYLKPKESTATITAIMPNGDEHTALAEATDAEATTKTGYEGYYTLDIENVAAHELGEMFDVTVKVNGTDDMKISVSGLSYVHSVLSSNSYTESTTPTKTVMENAVTALYNYYTATTQYQAAITNYPEYVGQTDEGN